MVDESASAASQEPRLLHRLLRGELDEADIHRAAEQAAMATAAAQPPQPATAEDAGTERARGEGWSGSRDEDDLASYCGSSADHVTTPGSDADVDAIIVSDDLLLDHIQLFSARSG